MPDGLALVLQRVERAKEQRCDLERDMRAWAKNGAYGIGTRPDPETGQTIFYVGEIKPLTPLSSALIGETIHSLRAALDHLAYQLFLICRNDTSDDGSKIEFPIYDDAKTTEAKAFRPIKTFRPEIIEAFHTINPCKSGNPPLWMLHRLDIVDKHRRILINFVTHHSIFVRDAMRQLLTQAGYADMTPWVDLKRSFLTSFRTGRRAQVGDILFRGMPGDEEVNKHLQFTFNVAFDEPGIAEGKPVIETLDEMLKIVENLVLSFAPFLV